MRAILTFSALVAVAAAGPVQAQSSLGGLAKTVLGGGAVLQRGADTCKNGFALTTEEQLALTLARQTAQSALPGDQFIALDATANSNAVTESNKKGFCDRTSKRKTVMLKAIRDAARKLATRRIGL